MTLMERRQFETWRLLPFHNGDTEDHMRTTDELVRGVVADGPVVWWHTGESDALVVGSSLKLTISENGSSVPVIVRPSGGGAVLTGPGVLGLDIALPAGHNLLRGDIVEDYRWIGQVWREALSRLGIAAETASIEQAHAFASRQDFSAFNLSCFASLSAYEVTVGGMKIVGLSQVRRRGGVLFASAIHLDACPARVADYLPLGAHLRRDLRNHLNRYTTCLSAVAPRPLTSDDVVGAFHVALTTMYSILLRSPGEPSHA